MKVIVCGDRNWNNVDLIIKRLRELPKGTHIIHGNCRGADKLAGAVAKTLEFYVTAYPANWKEEGYGAGPERNKRMLREKPDLVLAFHNHLLQSKGTKIMVLLAIDAGIPVEVIKNPAYPQYPLSLKGEY